VLAREANAGLSALTARLSALQAENEAIREELTQLRAEIRLRTDVADLSNGQRP
jgi:cell division protein FtsB